MLTGDDLSTQYFIAGTAIAILGIAVTQAGWTHRAFVKALFALGLALALTAGLWKPISEAFPRLRDLAAPIGSSPSAWLVLLVTTLMIVFLLDYRARTAANPLTGDKVATIACQIDALAANEAAARRDIVTTMTNLALGSNRELKSANDKITSIEANLGKNSTKLHEIGQESPIVFEIIMEVLAHSLLFNGIPVKPELLPVSNLTPDNIEHQRTIASEYWEAVREALGATQWEYRLRGIDQHAKEAADHFVREIPANERPVGIDVLDLRQYAIIRIRCEQTGVFVRAARAEASPKYRGWLSLMKQLHEARKSRS
jgi:hypothetical protein